MNSGKVAQAPSGVTTTELYGLFKEYADRPFVFVEPGGNAGDYLIYKGAEKLGDLVGLTYTSVSHSDFMGAAYGNDTVIYLHGSGGYNPIWSGTPMLELEKASSHNGVVIQGPATYWDDLDFLQERVGSSVSRAQCERLVLMARERVSYDLLQQVLPGGVEVILDHDTALNLERQDLEGFLRDGKSGYKLYAIRDDKESIDVAGRKYFAAWVDPGKVRQSLDGWVQLHADARQIVTNRLHSSICGSVLGIPTTLLPNSYFKNRAVWEHSLKERGVQWEESITIDRASNVVDALPPLRQLMRRGRVQRLVQWLHKVN